MAKLYNCDSNKYIMGTASKGCFAYNNTNALMTSTKAISVATVDATNSFLVFGSMNNQLKFVFANDFSQMQSFTLPKEVLSGDFTDDAQTFAVGCEDGIVRFYKRCGCASDSLVYNNTYCPGPPIPSCPINTTNTTTTNTTNITDTNSTNITDTNATNSTNATDPFNTTNTTNSSLVNETNTTSNSSSLN